MKGDDKIISKKCIQKLTKYLHFITITQEIVKFLRVLRVCIVLFRTILFSANIMMKTDLRREEKIVECCNFDLITRKEHHVKLTASSYTTVTTADAAEYTVKYP